MEPGSERKLRQVTIKKARPSPEELNKGQLLAVKAPPYYNKEYFYEVTSAGDKMVRATLYHSPTVRKSWKHEEFVLLLEIGVIRLVHKDEVPATPAKKLSDDQTTV